MLLERKDAIPIRRTPNMAGHHSRKPLRVGMGGSKDPFGRKDVFIATPDSKS